MKQVILALTFTITLIIMGIVVDQPARQLVSPQDSESALQAGVIKATAAGAAMKWYNDQRAFPTGHIPADWREKAERQIEKNNLQKSSAAMAPLSWTSIGPNNIGGRVRSILVDPSNSNTVYAGSVSGGVWKSTNAGTSWNPTKDAAPNLVIGCMAMDPNNSSVIYAGTGEGYFNLDALRGAGVLKTTDAGANWTLLTNFATPNSSFSYYYINKLYVRPDNSSIVYAAMLGGIWRSTDAGAAWTKLNVPSSSVRCTDLVVNPTTPDIMYAAFGHFSTDGIYKSTNGGTSWSKLTTGMPPTSERYERISLAIAASNPSVVYACLTDSNSNTHSIRKTTDAGANWSAVTTPNDNTPQVNGTHLGGQGWYNNVIAVDPTNANVVYTGGINLFKSTDGGTAWTRITDGYGSPFVHVDQHAIAFDPTNTQNVYFGNDGGVYKSTDGGTSFSAMNSGLAITQFYSGALHPSAEIYYGGTQDNGTVKPVTAASQTWSMVFGGDGGFTAVDAATPTTVYTEYIYLSFQKSLNSGLNWTRSMTGIPTTGGAQSDGTSDRCSFIAPFEMDPSNSQVLVAGTYRVFRTTDAAGFWTAISGDLTGAGASATISALAIAKSTGATIYAGTSGGAADSSRVWVTTNTGSNWTQLTKAPLPNRYVTSIAVHPTNKDTVIVTYSGYGGGHVFRSTNRGGIWTNISGDLPDLPVNKVIIDPANPNIHLIIGTDLGIFETTNGGTNWTQQNNGLANVSVADLDRRGDGILFAATHGRGMFRTTAAVGVGLEPDILPTTFALRQNYPNPFNPSTVISFSLPYRSNVQLKVYDASGREVVSLVNEELQAGAYSSTFEASGLATGVYFYRLIARSVESRGEFTESKKMLLVK